MTLARRVTAAALAVGLFMLAGPASGAELKILLPLGRTVYQTNERIDLSVVRSSSEALTPGDLALSLACEDGSRLAFGFDVDGAAVIDAKAVRTEHLHLDGRLLRPGRYAVKVACDGATAETAIELCSHIRRSPFRTIYWAQGNTAGPHQRWMGPDGLGFNLFWGQGRSWSEDLIRGGLDYMQCCTMGGGHQMDLRKECDWSDPYVLGGGVARVVRQALMDRTRPNVIGVHFYDEPGLTWWKHPRTGRDVPHNIPSQDGAYRAAFGRDAPPYDVIDPSDPQSLARWMHLGRWKLSFLDAAWRLARFGIEQVRPDYVSANQGMYGWHAYCDGYYFNVQRSLPVICGHGGYDLWGPGTFHPSLVLMMGRMREWHKPAWYLPTWSNETADRLRLQQYLSFAQGIQGIMVPPPIKMARPWEEPVAEGVVESNILMSRLGTIFEHVRPSPPPNAVLYSLSQNLHAQALAMKKPAAEANAGNYGHVQMAQIFALYVAHCRRQYPFWPVVEEDVLDGTLAARHRVVILPKVEYLPNGVIRGLEAFVRGGGVVYLSDDSTVKINGAKPFGIAVPAVQAEPSKMVELLDACEPVARTLKARLTEARVPPIFECDSPDIVAARHVAGDVEYIFAINAACDEKRGGYNPIRPTVATIRLPDDGRPVHDAVGCRLARGFQKRGGELIGRFRFGPGQMRVFVRTAGPTEWFTGENRPVSRLRSRSVAGKARRAVYFGREAENVFRFFRNHKDVTVVTGAADFHEAAAKRLVEALKPWQVRARIVPADEVNKPRAIPEEARRTWVGIDFGRYNAEKPHTGHTGFAIDGPAILLGTPEDNPLIAFLARNGYLPYAPKKDAFPGRGRGMIAWQRDGIGWFGQESITLIAYDADGMAEAVGALYEMAHGLEPLMTWEPPASATVAPGPPPPPRADEPSAPWTVTLPDRAVAIRRLPDDCAVVLTKDGTLVLVDHEGKHVWRKEIDGGGEDWALALSDDGKNLIVDATHRRITFNAADGEVIKEEPLTPSKEWQAPKPPTFPVRVPERTVVAFAGVGEGAVVAVAEDGAVLRLKSLEGKPQDRIAWEHREPGSLAKRLAVSPEGYVAIAYWGGLVHVLDASGKLRYAQRMEQDVADMVWVGKRLVVGTADGLVTALKAGE